MRRLISALILTSAGLGCGPDATKSASALAGPSMLAMASEFGFAVATQSPEAGTAGAQLQVTLRVQDLGTAGGAIDSGTVVVRDAQGNALASGTLPSGVSIPSGGVGQARVTLEWTTSSRATRADLNVSLHAGTGQEYFFVHTVRLQ